MMIFYDEVSVVPNDHKYFTTLALIFPWIGTQKCQIIIIKKKEFVITMAFLSSFVEWWCKSIDEECEEESKKQKKQKLNNKEPADRKKRNVKKRVNIMIVFGRHFGCDIFAP